MRLNALRFGLFVVAFSARAGGRAVTFEEYQSLGDAERRSLIRRYVRKAGDYWQVQLTSYLVRTDISEEMALTLAVKMDEFYRRFTAIFVGPFRIRARPELYGLKDQKSFHSAFDRWSGGRMRVRGWSAGMFAYVGNRYALFGCARGGEERLYKTLFHEGAHHLLYFYIGTKFPRWFNEGVATNFETWDVAFSSERNVYEEIWRSKWLPYLYGMATGKVRRIRARKPDLIALMGSVDADWLNASDPKPLYAQAWGFVNLLLSSGEIGQKNFNVLMGAFRAGRDPRVVLPPHIRVALASQYDDYISNVIVPHSEFSAPVDALIRAGKKPEAARLLETALGKYPENNELMFFKGLLALEAGDAKEAYGILKPLEKRFPRHPLLMRTLGEAALAAGQRFKATRWLRKAVGEDFRDERAKGLLKEARKPYARRPAPRL